MTIKGHFKLLEEVYTEQPIHGGGPWEEDRYAHREVFPPSFPYRNGGKLHERYLMQLAVSSTYSPPRGVS